MENWNDWDFVPDETGLYRVCCYLFIPDDNPANDSGYSDFFEVYPAEGECSERGDVTGDGRVDILDLAFIAANYDGDNLAADVNRDGKVDIFDLVAAANNYGQQVR